VINAYQTAARDRCMPQPLIDFPFRIPRTVRSGRLHCRDQRLPVLDRAVAVRVTPNRRTSIRGQGAFPLSRPPHTTQSPSRRSKFDAHEPGYPPHRHFWIESIPEADGDACNSTGRPPLQRNSGRRDGRYDRSASLHRQENRRSTSSPTRYGSSTGKVAIVRSSAFPSTTFETVWKEHDGRWCLRLDGYSSSPRPPKYRSRRRQS